MFILTFLERLITSVYTDSSLYSDLVFIYLHGSYNDDVHLNSIHQCLIYPRQILVEQPFALPTQSDYNFYTHNQLKLLLLRFRKPI